MLVRAIFLSAFWFSGSRADIIDRIAVTLDSQVITESEVLLEIRLTAFQNGAPLDFKPEAKREAAGRLIEQKLIRKEIEVGHYIQPNPADVEPMLKQMEAQRFHSPDEFRHALEKYEVRAEDLKAHLLWQLTLLRFIDVRFRPGIQITDQDIQQYFNQKLPELEKQAGPEKRIRLDDLRDKIQEALTDERVDQQLNDWLAETRKHMRIEFHPEAFQ
jgi:peptidyl-prolyl cis-trans isomerase SurA